MAAAAQLGINQWNCWLAIIPIIAGEGWLYSTVMYCTVQLAIIPIIAGEGWQYCIS